MLTSAPSHQLPGKEARHRSSSLFGRLGSPCSRHMSGGQGGTTLESGSAPCDNYLLICFLCKGRAL